MHLVVSHLACMATGQDIRPLFAPSGAVDPIEGLTARETSRPRGFGRRDHPKRVTVAMDGEGRVWVATPQGHILAECFFKAEDETSAELRQMGYPSLAERYPAAQITVGRGVEVADLADLFVES